MGLKQRSFAAHFRANSADVRTEMLRGQEYVVVPVVMLVEGVIQGVLAETPELALCSEFGANPAAWNGCPVSVMHPQRNQEYVAAGSPDIWESAVIGFLFNTSVQGESLTSEAWINPAWATESDFSDVVQKLQSGEIMEVSTGLFSSVAEVSGVWNGMAYDGIWTECQPDHLALLPNAIGACSVEMGAGTNRTPAINQALIAPIQKSSQRMLAIQQAFVNQSKEIAVSKATKLVAAKTVAKAFPAGKEKARKPGFFQRIMTALAGDEMSPLEKAFRDNLQGISDTDLRTALSTAMAAMDSNCYCYIVAVFDTNFVYETMDENYNWSMIQQDYSLNGDVVTISGEEIAVRPVTSFVPVSATLTETETITVTNGVVANAEAETSETSEASSEILTVEVGEEASAAVITGEGEGEAAPAIQEVSVVTGVLASTVEIPATTSVEDTQVIADTMLAKQFNASESDIKEALAYRAAQKEELISKVLGAKNNSFSKEELQAFTIQQLAKLADIAGIATPNVNYGAAAGAPIPEVEEKTFAPMQAFPRAKSNVKPFAAGGKKQAA